MSALGVQVWSPNLHNVELVPGKVAPVTNDNYGKPGGGLWTSTWDEDYGGGWLDWCIAESFRRPPFSVYLLTPDPGARVYVINSPEALLGLASRYPLPPRWPGDRASVDWVAVGLDYDAVHLTEAAPPDDPALVPGATQHLYVGL